MSISDIILENVRFCSGNSPRRYVIVGVLSASRLFIYLFIYLFCITVSNIKLNVKKCRKQNVCALSEPDCSVKRVQN